MPPIKPTLAKPVAEIPRGAFDYEPKWDGFRAIVFRDGDEVEIGSRNERPLTRYFPELVPALRESLPERCVVDGEIVLADPVRGRLDFEALQQRIHPAESRVRMLAATTPASFVAFDLLALGDRSLLATPFAERRAALEQALAEARPPIHLTPATRDADEAQRWFSEFEGAGLDGIVAKPLDSLYLPDKRGWLKIKHVRTADCVVAGYRLFAGETAAIGSLLLGLYDDDGVLESVGVVGAFSAAMRRELFAELQPLVTTLEGHPWDWGAQAAVAAAAEKQPPRRTPRSSEFSRWSVGKDLSFVPLRPERVIEVRYDHMEGRRFRHTAQFIRWRPDRDPASCTFAQLDEPVRYSLADNWERSISRTNAPNSSNPFLLPVPERLPRLRQRKGANRLRDHRRWAAARSRSPTRRKVYFPRTGHTKLDLVRYYLAVADGGAARGRRGGRWRSSAS